MIPDSFLDTFLQVAKVFQITHPHTGDGVSEQSAIGLFPYLEEGDGRQVAIIADEDTAAVGSDGRDQVIQFQVGRISWLHSSSFFN